MSEEFNINFGKGKGFGNTVKNDNIVAGIHRNNFYACDKDAKGQRSIFDQIDTDKDGMLEESEIERVLDAVKKYAKSDGNNNLSNKETKKLMKELGIEGKSKNFLRLLNSLIFTSYDQKSTTDDEGNVTVESTNNATPKEGVVYDKDGKLTETWKEVWYNNKGEEIDYSSDKKNVAKTEILKYNAKEELIGGKDDFGEYTIERNAGAKTYTKIYEESSAYKSITFNNKNVKTEEELSDGTVQKYNNDIIIYKKTPSGVIYEHNQDGTYNKRTDNDGSSWEYSVDTEGNYTWACTAGVEPKDGDQSDHNQLGYFEKFNSAGDLIKKKDGHGTAVYTYVDGGRSAEFTEGVSKGISRFYEKNQNGNWVETAGQLEDGTEYVVKRNADGEEQYSIYEPDNGNKYAYGAGDKKNCRFEITKDGTYRAHAKNGETFQETMERLGIDKLSDDLQKQFINANKRAQRKGWFYVSNDNLSKGDIKIPADVAQALSNEGMIENLLVDGDEELRNYKTSWNLY